MAGYKKTTTAAVAARGDDRNEKEASSLKKRRVMKKHMKFNDEGKATLIHGNGDGDDVNEAKMSTLSTMMDVNDEVIDFPRGRATTTTTAAAVAATTAGADNVLFNEDAIDEPSKKRVKKGKKTSSSDAISDTIDFSASKIRPVTSKKLSVGTLIWGIVIEVKAVELIIGISHGLSGVVPMLDVSAPLTKLLDNVNDETDDDSLPVLDNMFTVGSYVRCAVMELARGDKGRVRLSLDPVHVNTGLTASDVCVGMTLSGAVESVQDHGYVVATGVTGMRAFLKRERGPLRTLNVGEIVETVVLSVSGNSKIRNAVLDATPDAVTKAVACDTDDSVYSLSTLSPGILVNARVKKSAPNGLVVNFLGGFTGYIEDFHLVEPVSKFDAALVAEQYNGKKLKARVTYINTATKVIHLTLRADLVARISLPTVLSDHVKIGTIVENATVVRVDAGCGILLRLTEKNDMLAYARSADITDSNDSATVNYKAYAVNSVQRCRVLSYQPLEQLVRVSLRPSILTQRYMCVSDVRPGDTVEGTVSSHESYGMLVQISPAVRALCPTLQLADVKLKNPEKRMKVNSTVKCRVLTVDPDRRSVLLTNKRSLVSSRLPILDSYKTAVPGTITHGYISSVRDYGCLVVFYNNVRGLVPLVELSHQYIQKPASVFTEGQVVKCVVLSCDANSQKLKLSLKLTSDDSGGVDVCDLPPMPSSFSAVDANSLKAGDIIPAAMVAGLRSDGNLLVRIPGGQLGNLAPCQLSDHSIHWDSLASFYGARPGSILDKGLVVISPPCGRDILTLSYKPILRDAALDDHVGFVKKVNSYGAFIWMRNGNEGLAFKSNIADHFIDEPSRWLKEGQSVNVHVTGRSDDGHLKLSVKESDCPMDDSSPLLRSLLAERRLLASTTSSELSAKSLSRLAELRVAMTIAETVEGIVETKLASGSIIVNLHNQIQGVVLVSHGAADAGPVGSEVCARVLDINDATGICDLSMLPELLPSTGKKRKLTSIATSGTYAVDNVVDATIRLVHERHLVLSIGNDLAIAMASSTNGEGCQTSQRYAAGQSWRVRVSHVPSDKAVKVAAAAAAASALVGKKRKRSESVCAESNNKIVTEDPRLIVTMIEPLVTVPGAPTVTSSTASLKAGEETTAVVRSVQRQQLNVVVNNSIQGRIHITSVHSTDADPFEKRRKGDCIQVHVLGLHDTKNSHTFLPLSNRKLSSRTVLELAQVGSTSSAEMTGITTSLPLSLDDVNVDDIIAGRVLEVENDFLWVGLSPVIRGRVTAVNAARSTDTPAAAVKIIENLNDNFALRERVLCRVLAVDAKNRILDLSLNTSMTSSSVIDGIVVGRVCKVMETAMDISLADGYHGRIDITDVSDSFSKKPFEGYSSGDIVRCAVISADIKNRRAVLSLRPSRVLGDDDLEIENEEVEAANIVPGQLIHGYVGSIAKGGVFVRLGRNVSGRVQIAELSDRFVKNWETIYTVGQLVSGRVISVDDSGRIELTLKSSRVDTKHKHILITDLVKGMRVRGIVKSIQTYGVFIAIDHSCLSGLCHSSQVADVLPDGGIAELFEIGDRVKAVVQDVDIKKQRISLGLKASLLIDDDDSEEDDVNDLSDSDNDDDDINSTNNEDTSDLSSDDMNQLMMDDSDVDVLESECNTKPSSGSLSAVFDFENEYSFADKAPWHDNVSDSESESSADDDDDNGESDSRKRQSSKAKRARKAEKKAEEARIAAREHSLANEDGGVSPETADDFDRLVLASPNSSYVWIKYMAFHISYTEIEKARAVAERAIAAISYREEGERLNIWVALLNLENKFGTEKSILHHFKRAQQVTDQRRISLKLAAIYVASEKYDAADDLFKTICKKYGDSKEVWLQYGTYKMRTGKPDSARAILQQSLKALPRRKHIEIISKFGLLEFRSESGDAERGRTIFESVLTNYPKRLDLWSVYIDQEIRLGDWARVRRIFERITHLKLSTKKMKFFFKRFLDFEKAHGDQASIEAVKNRAREWITAKTAAGGLDKE